MVDEEDEFEASEALRLDVVSMAHALVSSLLEDPESIDSSPGDFADFVGSIASDIMAPLEGTTPAEIHQELVNRGVRAALICKALAANTVTLIQCVEEAAGDEITGLREALASPYFPTSARP
jgi:hypothetical protein